MVIICLIGIIIVLIAIIIGYKREFKRINKEITNNLDEYVNIKTKSVDKDVENLVQSINLIFDSKQKVVSEKKKSEDELRASITNMSHDLRTPLTSIMGYLQMIKSEKSSETDKKEYMDIVEKRTKSLQQLISSFYDLSRIEGNEYKFNYKKVNLSNILCENIALFYNDFINNNIEPVIEIEEGIKEIISDESAITRIFSNLIGFTLIGLINGVIISPHTLTKKS